MQLDIEAIPDMLIPAMLISALLCFMSNIDSISGGITVYTSCSSKCSMLAIALTQIGVFYDILSTTSYSKVLKETVLY